MSLFKAREWWAATTGSEEEFAPTAFCVADVDNQGGNKVATGSLSGLLRIYHPRQRGYLAEDLLLEQRLDAPIIQLAAGELLPGHSRLALAVLHPRKLAVYEVHAGKQNGAYHTLARAWESPLARNSFSMVLGRFGGRGSHESVAVQSIDGSVSVFEGEALSYTRLLANFLIPGPLLYSPRTNSLLTANSLLQVVSFKLSALALARADAQPQAAAGAAAGAAGGKAEKRIAPDWAIVVGEHVVDMALGRFTAGLGGGAHDVLVLGVQTLFALKEGSGQLIYQRRLDMQPSCMTVYPAGDGADPGTGGADNVLLCSATGAILVLRHSAILWAARAERPPIALAVSPFAGIKGLLVSLSAQGEACALYLGTDPPTNGVGGSHEKELDYDEMDAEHRTLLAQIRETTGGQRAEPADAITLRAQQPRSVDPPTERGLGDADGASNAQSVTVRVAVTHSGVGALSDVRLSVQCELPVYALRETIPLPAVMGGSGTPLTVPIVFRARSGGSGSGLCPTSMQAVVVASYVTADGQPRTARAEVQLPLPLVARAIPPVKSADFKVTLDTDQPPLPLAELFDDVLALPASLGEGGKGGGASGSALSLRLCSGHEVTALTSKNAGRYRLQSASFDALWLLAAELSARLRRRLPGVRVSFNEPLPLTEYFALIDAHFAARQQLVAVSSRLEQRARQFRVVQKRLLVRFKDRNPAPLFNLDALLSGTHGQIVALADDAHAARAALDAAARALACGTQLVNLLVVLRFDLDAENAAALNAHISARTADTSSEQGWEERTDAALAHALRTSLGKAGAPKESAASSSLALPPLAMPSDVSKLKKHITVVCDRLSKGGRFV